MQPWLRQESQPESWLLDRGVVYRAVDLGARVRMRRRPDAPCGGPAGFPPARRRAAVPRSIGATTHAYQISTPVADGTTIICHDPTGNKILRVDAANGSCWARDASAFGDVQYMLKVGRHCADRRPPLLVKLELVRKGRRGLLRGSAMWIVGVAS